MPADESGVEAEDFTGFKGRAEIIRVHYNTASIIANYGSLIFRYPKLFQKHLVAGVKGILFFTCERSAIFRKPL